VICVGIAAGAGRGTPPSALSTVNAPGLEALMPAFAFTGSGITNGVGAAGWLLPPPPNKLIKPDIRGLNPNPNPKIPWSVFPTLLGVEAPLCPLVVEFWSTARVLFCIVSICVWLIVCSC
jgi:hypothetical protein